MSYKMSVKLEKPDDLAMPLRDLKIPKYVMRKLSSTLLKEIRQRTPVDTGKLQASINAEIVGDTIIVGSDVNYAPFVEFGHFTVAGTFVPGRFMFRDGTQAALKDISKTIRDYFEKKARGK